MSEGVYRFLARVWRLIMEENQAGEWIALDRSRRTRADREATQGAARDDQEGHVDCEAMSFNTAIAQMMVCTNEFVTRSTNVRQRRW